MTEVPWTIENTRTSKRVNISKNKERRGEGRENEK